MKENTNGKKAHAILEVVQKYLTGKIIIAVLLVAVVVAGVIGVQRFTASENKTTKIGFEDIGELATQSAYCTQVNVTDSSRTLFGAKIPFTQSKYIYSYDVEVKAGFDFKEITWSEKDAAVVVKLPEAKILSSKIDPESFKVYHEDESIFNQITLEENNEAMASLVKAAEKDAVDNGLLEQARSNAEEILKGFFGSVYDLEEYKIIFE